MWQQHWCYMPDQMNGKEIFSLFWNAKLISHLAGTTYISSFLPHLFFSFLNTALFSQAVIVSAAPSQARAFERKKKTNMLWVFSCADIISCPSLSQWMCYCCHKAYAVSGVFFPPLLFKQSTSSLFSVMKAETSQAGPEPAQAPDPSPLDKKWASRLR